MTGRIILIGMPAGGKTTIGAALSRALSVPLYDADALTEQTVGCSIPEIFAAEGEAAFRALERRTLEALCTETETPCVIATGGGAVLTEQNRELLRRSGTSLPPPAYSSTLTISMAASSSRLISSFRERFVCSDSLSSRVIKPSRIRTETTL